MRLIIDTLNESTGGESHIMLKLYANNDMMPMMENKINDNGGNRSQVDPEGITTTGHKICVIIKLVDKITYKNPGLG